MDIGIPKEIQIEEKRISLAPQGVYSLVKEGHRVYIEKGAGLDGHFSDEDFQKVGGEIVYSHEEAFKRADLIVKVMPPTEEECDLLHEGQMIFSFLQLSLRTSQTMSKLIEKKVTAIGTELIETNSGSKPILEAMSEIGGCMVPQIAGRFLENTYGGRGITISGIPGIPPASITIFGVGKVGLHAASALIGLGAQVFAMDNDLQKLRFIDTHFNKRVITAMSNPYNIDRALQFSDVVIGSAFEYGKKAPLLVTRDQLSSMKRGALIIDIAIDQGGCFETSRPTTHSDPIYEEKGIIHYCVPNIPAAVARSASRAMNHVILPFVSRIGEEGFKQACETNAELQRGIFIHDGKCTNKGISEIYNLPYEDFTSGKCND